MAVGRRDDDPHLGHVAHSVSESCIPQCPRYGEHASMPRWPADHVKRPEPDHTHADLRTGLVWLADLALHMAEQRARHEITMAIYGALQDTP